MPYNNPLPEWLKFEDEELGIASVAASGFRNWTSTLYIRGLGTPASGNIPLYIGGTGASLNATLYIKGMGSGFNHSCTLFEQGIGAYDSGNIPLYLNALPTISESLNLII